MQCTACNGSTESSPNGSYARCTACKALYMVWEGKLSPVQIPAGMDAATFMKGIGFDGGIPTPMESTKAALAKAVVPTGVRVKMGGVNVDFDKDGVSVDPTKAIKKAEKAVENKISGWIWGCALSAVMLGFVVVILGLVAGVVGWSLFTSTGGGSGSVGAGDWDGKAPYVCPVNGHVSLAGVRADLPGKTAITAGGNCELELTGVDVSGDVAIEVKGNAKVTIVGGNLKGTTAAIKASANGSVDLTGTMVEGDVQKSGAAKVEGL